MLKGVLVMQGACNVKHIILHMYSYESVIVLIYMIIYIIYSSYLYELYIALHHIIMHYSGI